MRWFGTKIKSDVIRGSWVIIWNGKSPFKNKFRAVHFDHKGNSSQLPAVGSTKYAREQINEIMETGYILSGGELHIMNTKGVPSKVFETGNKGIPFFFVGKTSKELTADQIDGMKSGALRYARNGRFYTNSLTK